MFVWVWFVWVWGLGYLEGLDEAALDVPRLGSLDSRVDQALAASHRVEEHLLGGQPLRVRVLDEATRLGARVVLDEVRERPPPAASHISDISDNRGPSDMSVW